MTRLSRTLLPFMLMLLGPPALLLLWAHLVRPIWQGSGVIALFAAGLLGVAGVVSSPWSNRVQAVVVIVYILIAMVTLPFLSLLAVCSTGDCI